MTAHPPHEAAAVCDLDAVAFFVESGAASEAAKVRAFLSKHAAVETAPFDDATEEDERMALVRHIATCFINMTQPVAVRAMQRLISFVCDSLCAAIDEAAGGGVFVAKNSHIPNADLQKRRSDFVIRWVAATNADAPIDFLTPVVKRRVLPLVVACSVFRGIPLSLTVEQKMEAAMVALKTLPLPKEHREAIKCFLSACIVEEDAGLPALFALFAPHFRDSPEEATAAVAQLLCAIAAESEERAETLLNRVHRRLLGNDAGKGASSLEATAYEALISRRIAAGVLDVAAWCGFSGGVGWMTEGSDPDAVARNFAIFLRCVRVVGRLLGATQNFAAWMRLLLGKTSFFGALAYFVLVSWDSAAQEAQEARDTLLLVASDASSAVVDSLSVFLVEALSAACSFDAASSALKFQVSFVERRNGLQLGQASIFALPLSEVAADRLPGDVPLALTPENAADRVFALTSAAHNADLFVCIYAAICALPSEDKTASNGAVRSTLLLNFAQKLPLLDVGSGLRLVRLVEGTLRVAHGDAELLATATALLAAHVAARPHSLDAFSAEETAALTRIWGLLREVAPDAAELRALFSASESSLIPNDLLSESVPFPSHQTPSHSLDDLLRVLAAEAQGDVPAVAQALVTLRSFLRTDCAFLATDAARQSALFNVLVPLLAFDDSFVYLNAISTLSCFVYEFHASFFGELVDLFAADVSPVTDADAWEVKQRFCELFARIIRDFGDFFCAYAELLLGACISMLRQCEEVVSATVGNDASCVETVQLVKCGVLSLVSLLYEAAPYCMTRHTSQIFCICCSYLSSDSECYPAKAAALVILKYLVAGAGRRICDFLDGTQLRQLLGKMQIYRVHHDDTLRMNALDIEYQLKRILMEP